VSPSQQPTARGADLNADEILDGLRAALRVALTADELREWDLDKIGVDTPMLTLALDSLALMVVVEEIEERFAVSMSVDSVYTFTSVGDLVDHVRDGAAANPA